MELFFRIAVFVPVLFLIAIVVVAQQHQTAADTIKGAVARTVRWLVWTAVLLVVMTVLELLFIGF
ncbi:MAG: hypothetical protein ACE37K_08805 [Planctomycetota bacterium]|jgi:secreted protein with Ig-like and vWFA domain